MEGLADVSAIIYILLIVVLVGMFATFYCFIKFLASFASLVSATNQAAAERPADLVLTGGFLSLLRVLLYRGNNSARNTLLKNTAFFFGSFALTMGAAFLMVQLNDEHCVIPMTTTSANGEVTTVCDPSK